MLKVKYLTAICAMFGALISAQSAESAMVAAADHAGGYSNAVLDRVIKSWRPPMDGTERTVRILVMLDGDGVVEECTPIAKSGSDAADKAACDAVTSIGKFSTPPYGLPMDVFLSFWVGKAEVTPAGMPIAASPDMSTDTAPVVTSAPQGRAIPNPATASSTTAEATPKAQEQKVAPAKPNTTHKPTIQDNRSGAVMDEDDYYVKMVMRKIGPNVVFPPNLPQGELSSSLTVQVDKSGNIKSVKVSKGSGSADLDEALVKATQKTGKVNAPPDNVARDLFLTFIIKNH